MGFATMKIQGADRAANSNALASSLVVASVRARLYSVTVYNNNVAAQFIQVHDAAALPADTAVPKLVVSVPASSTGSFDFGDGRIFSNGIVICNSSTGPTKTIGAADCIIDSTYRNE